MTMNGSRIVGRACATGSTVMQIVLSKIVLTTFAGLLLLLPNLPQTSCLWDLLMSRSQKYVESYWSESVCFQGYLAVLTSHTIFGETHLTVRNHQSNKHQTTMKFIKVLAQAVVIFPAGILVPVVAGPAPVAPPVEPPVAPPVEPPVAPPIEPPVAPPVEPPVAPPVEPPVAPPVEPPVAPPVELPVAPPVEPPVAAPAVAPVAAPIAAPVATPVVPPVTSPVAPPIATPVAPPVAPPIAAPVAPPVASPVQSPMTVPTAPGGILAFIPALIAAVASAIVGFFGLFFILFGFGGSSDSGSKSADAASGRLLM